MSDQELHDRRPEGEVGDDELIVDESPTFEGASGSTAAPMAPRPEETDEIAESAASDEILTGEEVTLSRHEGDTENIIGAPGSAADDTSAVDPVPSTSEPRIPSPVDPVDDEGDAPDLDEDEPRDRISPPERDDLPAPAPRDVLENRHDRDEDETATDEDELERTAVHRRSLVSPLEEADPADENEANWHPRAEPVPVHVEGTPSSLDDAIFEGTTLSPEIPSRAGSHWWSFFAFLIFLPIAWFLAADAGARMTLADGSAFSTGAVNLAAIAELVGALVIVVLLGVTVARSSLGGFVMGILTFLSGLVPIVIPGIFSQLIQPAVQWLNSWNAFGMNLAHHFQASAFSGRFALLGLIVLVGAWVSHWVRRRGRSEEALRAEVEKINPEGAFFSWRARRRAAKARDEGR